MHAKRHRFLAVDAIKGLAMVFVILQHSYLSVNMQIIPRVLDVLIWNITSIAAVAFVAISGGIYSYFLYIHPHWKIAYSRYCIRAAFLILAAHPAINLMSYYFRVAGNDELMSNFSFLSQLLLDFPITDTIAICMLLAAPLTVLMNSLHRATMIATMLVLTILVKVIWFPLDPHWLILKEAVFGNLSLPKIFWFPLIPWFAIFLTGSFAGQVLSYLKQGTMSLPQLKQKMQRSGLVLVSLGIVLTIGYKAFKLLFFHICSPDIFLAIYPGQTTTLLPVYLGVLALIFSELIQRIDLSGNYGRFIWFMSVFGRTSLFTYVVQFAVVESTPALLGLKGTLGLAGFLILFIIGIFAMWILSFMYGRLRGWFQKKDYTKQLDFVAGLSRPTI